MTLLKEYFIYNERKILSDKKRFRIAVSLNKIKSLENLLENYRIDVDENLPDFLIVLDLFLITIREWELYNKASLIESRLGVKDHKNLDNLFDYLMNGDSIKTVKIKTKKGKNIVFASQVFQIFVGNWIHSQKKQILNVGGENFFEELRASKKRTKPSGINSYLFDHPNTFIFWHYLKDRFPTVKSRPMKFIADFLTKVCEQKIDRDKLSVALNAKAREIVFKNGRFYSYHN